MIRFLVHLMIHDKADKLVEKGYTRRQAYYMINHTIGGIIYLIIAIVIGYFSLNLLSGTFDDLMYNHIEKQLDRQSQEKRIERMKEESEEWMNRENKFYDTEYEKEEEPNEWYLKENKEQKEKETREWDSKSSSF